MLSGWMLSLKSGGPTKFTTPQPFALLIVPYTRPELDLLGTKVLGDSSF